MKILLVNNSQIPVTRYGGTERVIWYLGKELTKLGHEVTYLVKSGSTCPFAHVIAIDPQRSVVAQIPDKIDVVHFHFCPKDLHLLKKPYLITMHGNSNDAAELDINTVFVSQNHANRYGSNTFIYNGLDWNDYQKPVLNAPRNHFHFLGNAAWKVKNIKGSIALIQAAKNERLKVLGGVRFNFKMGLRFTFSPKIDFLGMVGGSQKYEVLNGSKGLVFPVLWHEPFGLAIIESLYYGCPVFGTPYGSLPELVGAEYGYLSNQKKDLVAALQTASSFSANRCHEYARTQFNSQKMCLAYLQKYQQVCANQPMNAQKPKLLQIQDQKLLDWL